MPASTLFSLDPLAYLATYLLPNLYWISFTLRYLIYQWVCLEASRTVSLMLSLIIGVLESTKKVLGKLSSKKLSKRIIECYKYLELVNGIGRQPVRKIALVMISGGFMFTVCVDFLAIGCHADLPIHINTLCVLLSLLVHIETLHFLPAMVSCYEYSTKLLYMTWPRHLVHNRTMSTNYEFKLLQRCLRCRQPTTYYYGNAKFDRDTKVNYFLNTVQYTIDMLLIE